MAVLLGVVSMQAGARQGEAVLLPQMPPSWQPGTPTVYFMAGIGGELNVVRGCVRLMNGADGFTVLWHRGIELGRDARGRFLRNVHTGAVQRFGEQVEVGGAGLDPEYVGRVTPEVSRRCGPPYWAGWF
ncbi:MAG: hypothetical protein QM772_15280 [Ottowia sp.]|uniref:hypothetical protein n=1 Tax=Ottowia sp. TaxID=1898956 RepID=UPI0039E3307A